MNIEEFREYCLSMKAVTEKTPFGKFARRYDSILVFYILDHTFCLVDMDDFTSVTVKSTPEEIEDLKMKHSSVSKPLNLSDKHWIQLNLKGDIPDNQIYALVRRAYDIVRAKYSKKKRCLMMSAGGITLADGAIETPDGSEMSHQLKHKLAMLGN